MSYFDKLRTGFSLDRQLKIGQGNMTLFTAAWQLKIDIETLMDFICTFHRFNVLNSEYGHFMRTAFKKCNYFANLI